MKKSLYFLALISALHNPIQAEFNISQKVAAVITAVKNRINPPSPEIPTIKVGYLSINKLIGHFEEDLLALKKFADNPKIDAIIITISSRGGSSGDAEILADYIYEIRKIKPIIAFVSQQAASAGYFIASACTIIIAPETSLIGSIGAVSIHNNKDNEVFIASGKYKWPKFIDNNNALDEDYKEYVQEYINVGAAAFFKKVSLYRNLDQEFIKNLEAKLFIASCALERGLIDQIGTISDLIAKTAELISEKTKKSYKKLNWLTSKNEVYASFDL